MKTCTLAGCARPHRARGLCSSHYNQTHQPDRHRNRKTVVPCTWCGKDCEKEKTTKYGARFCSWNCFSQWKSKTMRLPPLERARRAAAGTKGGLWTAGPCARCGVPFIGRGAGARYCSDPCATRAARRPSWVAGECRECGIHFVDVWLSTASSVYCSPQCAKRLSRRARRARQRNAVREHYRPVDVYRRDGWRCHICQRLVKRDAVVPHAMAPTIDHLVPLAGGGDDVLDNVACAHFICNARKTNLGGAQLLLFGDVA